MSYPVIDASKILRAEYAEDRWKLKNRVIYVGAGGQVLADVSEGAGDLPVIVNDPFLTDANEAYRRAQIRLALNKEYGRQLRVEMSQYDFEALGIDLGDTVTVNLPNLGISENMYVVEIEYDPRELKYVLTIGGRLELFEEFLQEQIGGDVASRFGQAMNRPEMINTMVYSVEMGMRIWSEPRHVIYWNRPPLTLYDASNIVLDDNGYATLVSGATSGSFEVRALPISELFMGWLAVEWFADPGQGSITTKISCGDNVVASISGTYSYYCFNVPRVPIQDGGLTEGAASKYGVNNAAVYDVKKGILHAYCLKLTPSTLGADGEIFYPSSKNWGRDLSWARWMRLYLYGDHVSDFAIKIRLHTDSSNYYEGSILVKSGAWRRYEIDVKTLNKIGSPSLSNINWMSIISPQALLIDSDYILLPATRELLRVKFELSRPSAGNVSPRIKLVRITWKEGS